MTNPEDQTAQPITVFSLGCGAQAQGYGPLVRQMTDDIAHGLAGFEGLLARPHHVLGALENRVLDPNLEEGFDPTLDPNGEMPDRITFILFSSLPADALVRRLTLQSGGRYALSGRMVLDRGEVDLAMNLWDVTVPNLLWCRVMFGELIQIPEMVAHLVSHLAYSLQSPGAETRAIALTKARARIGTTSYTAMRSYAAATDMVRRARLTGAALDHRRLPLSLCAALNDDPEYLAPRLMLLEHSINRFKANDTTYAEALLTRLSGLKDDRLVYDLLRFEAQICLKQTDAARRLLKRAYNMWGDDPRLDAAQARIPI